MCFSTASHGEDESVVRLRGLPYQASDHEVARFFRGLNIVRWDIILYRAPCTYLCVSVCSFVYYTCLLPCRGPDQIDKLIFFPDILTMRLQLSSKTTSIDNIMIIRRWSLFVSIVRYRVMFFLLGTKSQTLTLHWTTFYNCESLSSIII